MYISKVLQEYVVLPDEVEYAVRCRIVEFTDPTPDAHLRYGWDTSHYYKASATALAVYRPSKTRGATVEEAEQHMWAYVKSFTAKHKVEPNPYY